MSQQLIIEPSGQQRSVFEGETLLDSMVHDGFQSAYRRSFANILMGTK
jgi:CDP-4-dehydro-6-deoxyglucose reductase